MTTSDVSDTRISDERLRHFIAYVDLMGPHSDLCVDAWEAKAMATEILASRHPQPVKEPAEWQEISTAPTDGTPVWAISMDAQSPAPRVSWFDPDGRWVRVHTAEKFVASGPVRWWPTHWKPIHASERSKEGEAKPSWFAVQSVSGAHVGMWRDERIARRVFNEEYSDGRFIPLYAVPVPVTITDEMANAAIARSKQKDLDLLTNTEAMRQIIAAALSQKPGKQG